MKKVMMISLVAAAMMSLGVMAAEGDGRQNQFRFSTTVEKERPELNAETKALIAAYHRDPSEANKAALKKQIEVNYDKVIERKKAKLAELKRTAFIP